MTESPLPYLPTGTSPFTAKPALAFYMPHSHTATAAQYTIAYLPTPTHAEYRPPHTATAAQYIFTSPPLCLRQHAEYRPTHGNCCAIYPSPPAPARRVPYRTPTPSLTFMRHSHRTHRTPPPKENRADCRQLFLCFIQLFLLPLQRKISAHMKKNILASLAALALLCSSTIVYAKPTNVIYLIGDGMGFGAVSSLLLTSDELTGFEMAPVI